MPKQKKQQLLCRCGGLMGGMASRSGDYLIALIYGAVG